MYTPSDDTFLLVEAVRNHSGARAIEIGIGSGLVTKVLLNRFKRVAGTDISLELLRRVSRNIYADFVCCDGASAFREEAFDLITFNPPYLPSYGTIDKAVDGGKEGIEVSLKFLKDAVRISRGKAIILFVISSYSNYKTILSWLRRKSFRVRNIKTTRLFFEELTVFEASKNNGSM